VVVSQILSDSQNILVLICFFSFLSANLLPATHFLGWVIWRAAVLWTANQSGHKVSFVQLSASA